MAAFFAVSTVVIATPGPDTALTIRNTLLCGRRSGLFTALGVSSAGDLLRRPSIRRALEVATGMALLALGLRLALVRG